MAAIRGAVKRVTEIGLGRSEEVRARNFAIFKESGLEITEVCVVVSS